MSHVIEDTTNHVILDKDFEIDNGACSGEQTPTRRETPTKTKKAVFIGNQGFNKTLKYFAFSFDF